MTSARRAILVSEDDILPARGHLRAAIRSSECVKLAERYDNAGDQPRANWCVTHSRLAASEDECGYYTFRIDPNPCRVVSAIIVVEEDA